MSSCAIAPPPPPPPPPISSPCVAPRPGPAHSSVVSLSLPETSAAPVLTLALRCSLGTC